MSVQPPENNEVAERIDKLAAYVRRNGERFETLIRSRHEGDSAYGFLFGGEGSEYYSSLVRAAKGPEPSEGSAERLRSQHAGTPGTSSRDSPANSSNSAEGVDFSFPVGLIPDLVDRAGGGYAPISHEDIREALSAARSVDAVEEKALLREFYHEIHARYGVNKGKRTKASKEPHMMRPPPGGKGVTELPDSDALYAPPSAGHVGLGVQLSDADDPYSAFRQRRSGAYHKQTFGR